MRKLRVLIMDDEAPALEDLRYILEESHLVEIIGECRNGLEVLDRLQKGAEPDLVFLDIETPEMGGLETAEAIRRINESIKIVFATGFSQFAVQAFEMEAFDYVMKPYDEERIDRTIQRARSALRYEEERSGGSISLLPAKKLAIYVKDKILILDPSSDVIFVKTEKGNNTLFYTNKGILSSKISLKEAEKLLGQESFCRTHKSYIVNLNKIKEMVLWFNDTFLLIVDHYKDEQIPVSRHFMPEFKKRLHLI